MFQNQYMVVPAKCKPLLFLLILLGTSFLSTRTFAQTAATIPSSVSSFELASKNECVVIRPVVNMYSKPSQSADVISQAIYGTNVFRIKAKWHWANIRTADNYAGWVRLSNLRKLNGQPYPSAGSAVRVSELSANLYREPNVTKHAPLLTIPWESRLEALPDKVDENNRWLKVRLPDGTEAFVQNGDVSSNFTPLTVDQMIAVARTFLGVTYTWGGSSDFGFDCSGFTQMLLRQRGIVMPRDADLQAAWSGVTPIERNQLRPGDLLFFGDRPDRITHTGMYIGNGQFIHDTTHNHPGVQISLLDDQPWTKLLVAARRPKS
ncbi:MAG: SH3 domain-containing C40 family peptidase [Candidatus Acidiferrum sp.]